VRPRYWYAGCIPALYHVSPPWYIPSDKGSIDDDAFSGLFPLLLIQINYRPGSLTPPRVYSASSSVRPSVVVRRQSVTNLRAVYILVLNFIFILFFEDSQEVYCDDTGQRV
jgi:hypothetical protein